MSASEKPHHIDISVTLPLMYSHRLMAQIADPHAERNRAHRRFLEPDGMRELHWQTNSDELQYYIEA